MATLDYQRRLQNLQNRKYDSFLNESFTSRSFSDAHVPANIKYMFESMRPLDQNANNRSLDAARRVQEHLEKGYNLPFGRAYRKQGSVTTQTNIKVYSDVDLLTIIDRYYYLPSHITPPNPYKETVPEDDIQQLRSQAITILRGIYDEVDASGTKSIAIYNKSLNRKVDVVFCFWYNSQEYEEQQNEYYRGVYLYDFTKRQKVLDFPFAHISSVNLKGDRTIDGSRRGIRLLKNLKADAETDINLSSFQLTTAVHGIDNNKLPSQPEAGLTLANSVSEQLKRLIEDPVYRKAISSPNGTEQPLANDSTVLELRKLKTDLDELILDCGKELQSPAIKRFLSTY